MRMVKAISVITAFTFAGCSSTRGGYIDAGLDKAVYRADTKAERLLRYFEVQALLVEFAAHSAGSDSERASIAAANAAASYDFIPMLKCLQVGAIDSARTGYENDTNGKLIFDKLPAVTEKPAAAGKISVEPDKNEIEIRQKYCSFFDSRMIKYEGQLLNLLRQVVRDDLIANELISTITGTSTISITKFVSILTLSAETYIRDERILSAFKSDALELEVLILSPERDESGRTISKSRNEIDDKDGANGFIAGIHPERDDTDKLRRTVTQLNSISDTRPTVKNWHFYEVYSYMLASCVALNGNAEIKSMMKTRCTTNLSSAGAQLE